MEPSVRDFLGFKVKTIAKLISQNMTNGIASLDLTGSQAFLLGYLCRHREERLYARDIEQQFKFSHPTISGLLQRLEAKGFLVICPSDADRRCKEIKVTDRAMEVNQQILSQLKASESQLVAGMTPEEVSLLTGLLNRMISNITPSSEGGIRP